MAGSLTLASSFAVLQSASFDLLAQNDGIKQFEVR